MSELGWHGDFSLVKSLFIVILSNKIKYRARIPLLPLALTYGFKDRGAPAFVDVGSLLHGRHFVPVRHLKRAGCQVWPVSDPELLLCQQVSVPD